MKSFRQFLEQITAQEFSDAQQAAQNSPAERMEAIREREIERRKKYTTEVEKVREAQRRLLDKQKQDREQTAEEQRQRREQERQQREQERANRQSGIEED